MSNFSYKARDRHGEHVSGVIEASSKGDALQRLQRDGLAVTDLQAGAAPIDEEAIRVKHAAARVQREEVISFANQLAVMLETGVPLREALQAYVAQSRGSLRRVAIVVERQVSSGVPLSDALAEFPKVFPNLMVSLVRASEASGSLDSMLTRIAAYLQSARRTVRQIQGALTYPAVMVGIATSVTVFLVIWVLPRFATIYESREATLPAATRFVIGVSDLLAAHWLSIVVGIAAIVSAIVGFGMTEAGRSFYDLLRLRSPVIGPMYSAFYLSRSMRTLSTLLAAGVNMLEAVRIVRNINNSVRWQRFWNSCEAMLTDGKSIADVVRESSLLPPNVAQMVIAGERSGRLPEVLEKVADATEQDLDESVKTSTQLIEPAMIVFMGLTVGGIAIALLLPIFSVATAMSN